MFSPQHNVQSPAVGSDTQVHAPLHVRTVHTRLVRGGRLGSARQTLTSQQHVEDV